MKVSFFLAGVILCSSIAVTFANKKEDFKCVDGEYYSENGCYNCKCHNGNVLCNLIECSTDFDPKYRNCEIGTTWNEGSDQCWCIQETGTVCTFKSRNEMGY